MPRIFVRRGCAETYDRLREVFAEEPDVQILWDRRADERRRTAGAPSVDLPAGTHERRQVERRKPRPPTWLTLDFVVAD
ncbi:MAG: hypothetical protein KGN76_10005 [Acidobacteriota bacterium]|nr:hypothetical protein [Acidobacteriota bacterium]